MDITYKILWIDDEDLTNQISRIERYIINEHGFEPKVCKCKSESEMNKHKLDFKDFDLIILDYQLSSKKTTDNILKRIKEKDYCSEVLFYSSKVKFLDHIKDNIKLFEGVFFEEGRSELINKIKEIIDLTLKKVEDINNLRGLVMAESSNLSLLTQDIIELFFKSKDHSKELIKKKIIKKLEDSKEDLEKQILILSKLKDIDFINYIVDKADFNTKSCNVHRINKVLPKPKIFKHDDFYFEIIEPRNNLAHVEEKIVRGVKILEGKNSKIKLSSSYFKKMRDEIKSYKSILLEIKEDVSKL